MGYDSKSAVSLDIASGAALSEAFRTGKNRSSFGVEFPSAFTGATVTFLGSNASDGTFVDIHNASGAISITKSVGNYVGLGEDDARMVLAYPWVKVKSASNEAAGRVIKAIFS